ncbi:MAG: SWIM zinc finger family protein, partial [Candidatus Binatia bacterium]
MNTPTTRALPAGELTVRQVALLQGAMSRFGAAVRTRGQQYAATNRVGAIHGFSGEPPGISAQVYGSEVYETAWEWVGGHWFPECTCPAAPYCKHAYALAWCVLEVVMSTPLRAGGRDPAPPRAAAGSLLGQLRAATAEWARQRLLIEYLRTRLGGGLDRYGTAINDLTVEADPDVLCWRLAQEGQRHHPGPLPAELEPYRDRPDLAARVADRLRAQAVQQLAAWGARHRREPSTRLRLVVGLARGYVGGLRLALQVRVTSPRLIDEPRRWPDLHSLRAQCRQSPGLLASDHELWLELLCDAAWYDSVHAPLFALNAVGVRGFLRQLAESPLATWADDVPAALAGRGGIVAGQPVRARRDRADLLPVCTGEGDAVRLALAFRWGDGREAPLAEALYLRGARDGLGRADPSLVLHGGEVSLVRGEPPDDAFDGGLWQDGLPLPREQRGAVLAALAPGFPHLADVLAAHTLRCPVRPSIALDLQEDDWLYLRLFASHTDSPWQPGQSAAPDDRVFELTPDKHWERLAIAPEWLPAPAPLSASAPAPPSDAAPASTLPSPTDIWHEEPDPAAVASARAWLATTPAAASGEGGRTAAAAWRFKATGERLDAFALAWEARPTDVP